MTSAKVPARRLYAPVVLLLLAAGGAAFFAGSRAWARTTVTTSGLPSDDVAATGAASVPLVSALSLVVVAGTLAVLASSVRVRRVVGVVLAVAAAAAAVLAATSSGAVDDALTRAVRDSTAFTGRDPDVVEHTIWPWVTVLALVVAAVLALAVVRWSSAWPTMGSRYDAPKAHAVDDATPLEEQSEADIWKALDEGHDPTR